MSFGNFNPPPPISEPQHAPWTDAQIANSYLKAIWLALTTPPGDGGGGNATLNDVVAVLNKILATLTNASGIQTIDVPVTDSNQQIQFTTLTIPDGFPLLIQSHPDNDPSGRILVAPKNGSLQFNVVSLTPGQFVSYKVTTSDALYIVGTVVGDIVVFTSEVK